MQSAACSNIVSPLFCGRTTAQWEFARPAENAPVMVDDPKATASLDIMVQMFRDYCWVVIHEAESATQGVVALGCTDATSAGTLTAAQASMLTSVEAMDSPASVDVNVLLGPRDEPLTNVLNQAVVRALSSAGELRPALSCIAVHRVAPRLSDAAEKKAFLALLVERVMHAYRLAQGEGAMDAVVQ